MKAIAKPVSVTCADDGTNDDLWRAIGAVHEAASKRARERLATGADHYTDPREVAHQILAIYRKADAVDKMICSLMRDA